MNYSINLNQWLERHLRMQLDLEALKSEVDLLRDEIYGIRTALDSIPRKAPRKTASADGVGTAVR